MKHVDNLVILPRTEVAVKYSTIQKIDVAGCEGKYTLFYNLAYSEPLLTERVIRVKVEAPHYRSRSELLASIVKDLNNQQEYN